MDNKFTNFQDKELFNRKFLKSTLLKVRTIALVGASSNPSRESYKVMEFLIDSGYKVYPVNPNEADITPIDPIIELEFA